MNTRDNVNLPELTVHYYAHPNDANNGMGHIAVEGKMDGTTRAVNIYPSNTPSINLAISHMSGFSIPIEAVNKPIHHNEPGYSPITASYKLDLPNPHAAYAKINEINKSVTSKQAGFSTVTSPFFSALHALRSPLASLLNMHHGMKMFDRPKVKTELEKVHVTNCAHSVNQVLVAGGLYLNPHIFSYQTPSGIHNDLKKLQGKEKASNSLAHQPSQTINKKNL